MSLERAIAQLVSPQSRRPSQRVDEVIGEHASASEPTETGANDEEIGETPISVANDAAKRVIVSFESDPTGAIVRLDDHLLCQDNSKGCKRVVEAGQHTLAIEKEGYISRRESITVTATTDRVHKKLDKNVGWLSVRSKPSGLEVKLDTRRSNATKWCPARTKYWSQTASISTRVSASAPRREARPAHAIGEGPWRAPGGALRSRTHLADQRCRAS